MHLIFLAKLSKSLCKSASLINDGVGEKPKPFSWALISVLDNTFLFRLNMESEEKEPLSGHCQSPKSYHYLPVIIEEFPVMSHPLS